MSRQSGRTNRVEPTGVQVTRRRRRVSRARVGVFGGTGRRRGIIAVGAMAVILVAAGATYASTVGFGENQVGTQYPNGIQVSDDQIIKPIGDRLVTQFGKFMGSTVSPDGRFLAATSADKPVALQIFNLSGYKLIWTAGAGSQAYPVNQTLTDSTVGQEGPDLLARRQVPLASAARCPDPVPGQPGWHSWDADSLLAPDDGHPPCG